MLRLMAVKLSSCGFQLHIRLDEETELGNLISLILVLSDLNCVKDRSFLIAQRLQNLNKTRRLNCLNVLTA